MVIKLEQVYRVTVTKIEFLTESTIKCQWYLLSDGVIDQLNIKYRNTASFHDLYLQLC